MRLSLSFIVTDKRFFYRKSRLKLLVIFSAIEVGNLLLCSPFEVTVNVNVQNISAILPIHYSKLYVSQPRVKLNQLLFEMKKKFLQTRLQVGRWSEGKYSLP